MLAIAKIAPTIQIKIPSDTKTEKALPWELREIIGIGIKIDNITPIGVSSTKIDNNLSYGSTSFSKRSSNVSVRESILSSIWIGYIIVKLYKSQFINIVEKFAHISEI
jgi:hypothetical protein